MESILITVQVIVTILLIGVIMLQKTNSDSVNTITGGSNAFVQNTSSNFFTKTTSVLAAIFMLNSLALSITMDKSHHASPISDRLELIEEKENSAGNKSDDSPVKESK